MAVEYSYAQVTYPAGLVAAYTFSQNANDKGPNHYHGVGRGLVTFNDTLAVPNDYDSFVTLPAQAFNGLGDFTIYCKFKFLTINSDLNLLFSGATPASANYFTLYYVWRQGEWGFSYQNMNYTFRAAIPQAKRWYCLMFTRTNNTFSLYIDGVKASNELVIDNQPLHFGTAGLVLGQEQDCVGGCFEANQNLNGKLDNFCVFNRALTTEEIAGDCIDPVTITEPLPVPTPAPLPEISPADKTYLPNVITPNQDGLNDFLTFDPGTFPGLRHLTICNRWGEIVFTTKKYNNDWNADSLSGGMYYYYFSSNGVVYKSWLSVLR